MMNPVPIDTPRPATAPGGVCGIGMPGTEEALEEFRHSSSSSIAGWSLATTA
jgi:hypothetical protein